MKDASGHAVDAIQEGWEKHVEREAIAHEREMCAQTAESLPPIDPNVCYGCAEAIAKAIREQTPVLPGICPGCSEKIAAAIRERGEKPN